LRNAGCRSPQRPWNAIHGNAFRAAAGSLGISFTTGSSSRLGPVVSSQPIPCSAERPMYRAEPKKFACDPAAG
jgi:hypothetical protein